MKKTEFTIIDLDAIPRCPECSNRTKFIGTSDTSEKGHCLLGVECGVCGYAPVGAPKPIKGGTRMGKFSASDTLDIWRKSISMESIEI